MKAKETMTAGKETAKTLNCIANYKPEENSYVLDGDGSVLKVGRIIVFSEPNGKLTFKRILMTTCGIPVEESVDSEPLFSTTIANNVVSEDDIFYFSTCFNENYPLDKMARTIVGELSAWGINTVKKEDGYMLPLQAYVNQTILKA